MTDVDPPAAPVPAPPRRWTKLVLILSLALNLLFLGAIGGAILRDGPHGRNAMLRELNLGPLTEAFSEGDRAALRRAFMGKEPNLRAERREMQGDMTAMLDLLRAPSFQRDDLARILARQVERTERRLGLAQGLVLDLIAEMTPEARSRFADRLEEAMKRRPKPGQP